VRAIKSCRVRPRSLRAASRKPSPNVRNDKGYPTKWRRSAKPIPGCAASPSLNSQARGPLSNRQTSQPGKETEVKKGDDDGNTMPNVSAELPAERAPPPIIRGDDGAKGNDSNQQYIVDQHGPASQREGRRATFSSLPARALYHLRPLDCGSFNSSGHLVFSVTFDFWLATGSLNPKENEALFPQAGVCPRCPTLVAGVAPV
jgi:hypothetical protein